MVKEMCTGSMTPVFISHCAPYNFLREYRLGCDDDEIPAKTLIGEAVNAWQALDSQEKSLFEEASYLPARFGQSSNSTVKLYNDVLAAQQTIVRRMPRTRSLWKTSQKSKKIRSGIAKSHRTKK
ncbi:uncharacterized protein LOC108142530 [Drosophila elegans]|uniref:uncharacterized protein LOC108142530 n=1 Tax=Drosophila elegans TaxID=30023 RepID=UPI0007E86777|nr:uncharacterized protein LOC108142530 [Drosophila elegans]